MERIRDKKAAKKEEGKERKKKMMEEIDEMDTNIQRNVRSDIIKNKGLMRKRKKIDRNPRVKGRFKYERAQKRRSNVVREF